jgi:ABC-2 type transport system permease protein
MTTEAAELPHPRLGRRRFHGGWAIVARKEMADQLTSVRFIALLAVLGLTAAGAVYSAAGGIRSVAPDAVGIPGLFLKLFSIQNDPVPFSFVGFFGFLAPLLGIAFGFDAIVGERSGGTLPRLVSQPIHRDDVINGKFVASLLTIGILLVALTLVIAGVGIVRLGIVPGVNEVARLMVWLLAALAYVAVWLALATLCSVAAKRAATSALVAIAVWLVVGVFGTLLAHVAAGIVSPPGDGTGLAALQNAKTEQTFSRLSPVELYQESTDALLNPNVRTVGIVTLAQVDRAVTSNLTFDQSVLLVWPQLVGLIAATVVIFAFAYVAFMRQEVRA